MLIHFVYYSLNNRSEECALCREMPEIHKLVVKLGQKLHTPQDTWFQVFFLGDDDHMVDVVETQDINFEEVVACVKLGGSVFITYKKDI